MESDFILWLIVAISILIIIAHFSFRIKKDLDLKKRVNEMVQNKVTKNAKDFLNDYKLLSKKRNGTIIDLDNSGIYVIFNSTKNLFYVGQSKRVLKRVRSHLTGSGNGDIYADFKYGDNFEVTIHKCNEPDLNIMERAFISKYNSSSHRGYNKNKGNSN